VVRISRASRRRAERERKKREKREISGKKREKLESKKPELKSTKESELQGPRSIPWDEDSPKCPDCGSEWTDEGDTYQCFSCGRFCMKTDLGITDCERCDRSFLYESLESWTSLDDDDFEEHLLCAECLTAVFVHGDTEWLKKGSE
jgi:hypothetical protein